MERITSAIGPRHALVVDNERDICEVIQLGLEETGVYRVTCAVSAKEAIPILDKDPPDIAIIDALLPGMSGVELAAETLSRGIPTVLITGSPEMMERLHRAEVPHVLKPFRFRQFIATIENAYAELSGSRPKIDELMARVTALRLAPRGAGAPSVSKRT